MKIFFGLEFDELVYKEKLLTVGGLHYLGPKGLLYLLESHLGLTGHANDNEHIRIEQYRQCLQKHLAIQPSAFYADSFQADQLATAARLLRMHDELALSRWDFKKENNLPERLKTFSDLEALINQNEQPYAAGFADRFVEMLKFLSLRKLPISAIVLNEPLNLLPPHFKMLFEKLKSLGVNIFENEIKITQNDSDLSGFQQRLSRLEKGKKASLKGDGSLLVIRSPRETEAATFLAKLFRQNPDFKPLCLVPEKNRSLDNALMQEGLPSPGILSASLARPSLQILKLIPAFLWRPIDPYKIMEFVSLAVKPLADDLAELIAGHIAQKPGMNSDSWRFMIRNYFSELKDKAATDQTIDADQIEQQYKFWFERKRYDANKTVPVKDVVEIFNYLTNWAFRVFDEGKGKNASMLVLSGQARRIVEMLEALPKNETQLTYLGLERIVRTIYEPSPVNFRETEVGHLPFVYHSSAVTDPVDELVWWNFTRSEYEHFFSKWYPAEIDVLKQKGIELQSPGNENALLLWQRPCAILRTKKRAILVIPDKINGSAVFSHPLYDELEATFDNLEKITVKTNDSESFKVLETYFNTPKFVTLPHQRLGKPKPFLRVSNAEKLEEKEYETFSSLDALLYYPYQWVFRHKAKLIKSSILSIVSDVTLMGNLAHRFFELLLQQPVNSWTKDQIDKWIDENSYDLLAKEGTVLLLYGREPERVAFINKIKFAAWSLVSLIQNNGWTVVETEMSLDGQIEETPIKGKADLVLQRGDELLVIDIKWRGATFRQNMIKNEEDLQLVTYSHLLKNNDTWAHTAYFIIENGKMIARNNLAFREIIAVTQDSDHIQINSDIWNKMQQTYRWRLEQLSKGLIEIRTQQTLPDLEDAYSSQLMEILEMKDADAPFDDYRTLINLVE